MIEYLRQLKKKSHMTNQQIAEKSNIPESTVARIFSGKTPNPTMTTVVAMTRAMGGSPADLLEKAEENLPADSLADLSEPTRRDAEKEQETADSAVTLSVSDSDSHDAAMPEPDGSEAASALAYGMAACEKYYEGIIDLYKNELKKKDVWISRLFRCLVGIMLFILFVLVFDILHAGFGFVKY